MSTTADNPFKERPKFCYTCGVQVIRIYRTGYYKENGNAVVFEHRKCPNAPWYSIFSSHPVTKDDALSDHIY